MLQVNELPVPALSAGVVADPHVSAVVCCGVVANVRLISMRLKVMRPSYTNDMQPLTGSVTLAPPCNRRLPPFAIVVLAVVAHTVNTCPGLGCRKFVTVLGLASWKKNRFAPETSGVAPTLLT